MLNWFSQVGEKLAATLGERTDYGTAPLPHKMNGDETHRIHELLPYRSYDPLSQFFHNEESVGFIVECSPMVGCSETMQREISGLFQHTLPEGTSLQFLLWADPKIEGILDQWAAPRKDQGSVFATLAQKRTDYLKRLVFKQDSLPLRDFRCVISFSQKGSIDSSLEKERWIQWRYQVVTILKNLGVSTKVWEAKDLICFLDGLINFKRDVSLSDLAWNSYTSLHEQIPCPGTALQITKEGIYLPESETMIKAYGVRREPDYWSLHSMGELIGDPLRDLMRVQCPFLLHYGVTVPGQESTKTRIQSREGWVEAQAVSKIGQRIPVIVEQSRELDFVRHQLSKGERFVQTGFQVLLFTPVQEAAFHDQTLTTLFRSKRWQLAQEKYLHLPAFLSCLPMMWGEGFPPELHYHQRLKTTLSTESANLLPIQGEWKGTESPGMLLVGRRGQLFTWSPFDNNAGNYNVCVVGRSGSGKSFFMQELMTSTLGQGGQVFVLDVGRSFEKTVKFLGGTYLEFTPETDICINPFSTIPTDSGSETPESETQDALAMLKPILSLMAAPRDGTNDLENALLEQALKQAWDRKGQQATITDVASFLSSHDSPIGQTLGQKLFPYTREGSYGRFFEGPATVDLSASLVVVELEELKERKDLQSVIVQMVILQITNKMYLGDRKTPSHLVLDEAWDMLRGKQSGEFIETAARRLRKYRGSLVVGTQSVNDFFVSAGAQAAFENSDWMCLLSQKKESIEQLKKSNRLSLDPVMESLLTSVHTRQGDYAEVMIYGPHGYAIGRLVADPYSRVLYSTKAEEFSAVQEGIDQGLSLSESLEKVSEQICGP